MPSETRQLLRLPVYVAEGLAYHLGGVLFTPKPRMVQFPVCDRCDARCIMCHRWRKGKTKEITIHEIQRVFTNRLFSRVEEVCLHGGEPTLRSDLADICRIIQDACPRVKRIWISTNGFAPKRIERRIQEILAILDFGRIGALEVNVSIDGLGRTHDRIRGVDGGFERCIETIHALTRLGEDYPIRTSIGAVIQPLNLHEIDGIEDLAKELGLPIVFQPLMFDTFFNISESPDLKFSRDDTEAFGRIIERKLATGHSSTSFYWCDLLAIMKGARRRVPCAFDRYVLSLYPSGEVLPCSKEDWVVFGNVHDQPVDRIWFSEKSKETRKRMKRELCPSCPLYCAVEFSLRKEFFKYAAYYLKKRLLHQLVSPHGEQL